MTENTTPDTPKKSILNDFRVPDRDLTREELDELAEVLFIDDIEYISRKKQQLKGESLRAKISDFVDDADEIYRQNVDTGFYECAVELGHLSVVLRTIPGRLTNVYKTMAARIASELGADEDYTMSVCRLACHVVEVNGIAITNTPPMASYRRITRSNDWSRPLEDYVSESYDGLMEYDELILSQLLSIASTWNFCVIEKMNSFDLSELAKN